MFGLCSWFSKQWGQSSILYYSLAWSTMRFGSEVWIRIMVIFRWLFFSSVDTTLHLWLAVSSWPNYLILWGSSTQDQVKFTVWIHPPFFTSTILHPIVSMWVQLILSFIVLATLFWCNGFWIFRGGGCRESLLHKLGNAN